jgi:hypothetical protein
MPADPGEFKGECPELDSAVRPHTKLLVRQISCHRNVTEDCAENVRPCASVLVAYCDAKRDSWQRPGYRGPGGSTRDAILGSAAPIDNLIARVRSAAAAPCGDPAQLRPPYADPAPASSQDRQLRAAAQSIARHGATHAASGVRTRWYRQG